MIQEQEKLDNALALIKDIKERAKTRHHLWLHYLKTSGKKPDDIWILEIRELDQEEKDAEACETIDSYDDAMLDIHARRIDLLKEYGFYA